MTDKTRARNCNKCKFRKSQELFMNKQFDYTNCPCVCIQNKLFDKLKVKRVF